VKSPIVYDVTGWSRRYAASAEVWS